MPYATNEGLPSHIKKYEVKVQSQWRHVFNTVHETSHSEARAFKSANSILKKRMVKDKNSHDYINHMVDMWMGKLDG